MTQQTYNPDELAGQLLLLGATKVASKVWRKRVRVNVTIVISIHASHAFVKTINLLTEFPYENSKHNLRSNESVIRYITNRLDK